VNSTGTFICAVEVANYTPVFVSLYLTQEDGEFSVILVCLDSSNCRVEMTVYDYSDNTLRVVGVEVVDVTRGEKIERTYSVLGRGVIKLVVNDVYLGYYAAQSLNIPTAVPPRLRELAQLNPVLAVTVALIIIGIPLSWVMQRELGVAGLALAGASMLIYVFTRALTGSDPVAVLTAVVSCLIGLIFIIMHGGST